MPKKSPPVQDTQRRNLLAVGTAVVAGVGITATTIPLVASLAPPPRSKKPPAPLEVDIATLKPGERLTVKWHNKPIWIIRRTPEMLATLPIVEPELADPHSQKPQQPSTCANATRSLRPDILVLVGICTHLGCTPLPRFAEGKAEKMPANWRGGFYCACHAATFDLAGRVYKNKPAPKNLLVPPYRYLSDTRLVIGEIDS